MKSLMTSVAVMAIAAMAATVGSAQTPDKSVLAKHWKTSGEFTVAVAEAMPAESYNFRPTPEEMNFGELMVHIAMANISAGANASGLERIGPPEKVAAAYAKDRTKIEVDKETAIAFLKASFEYVDKAIAAAPAERLTTVVGPPARNLTGVEWLWSYFTHAAHHRGQAEVYLRLKGIKPPAYVF